MEDLSRIEAQLESLGELSDLVGALRSMAAARSREAHEALEGMKHYCAAIERAIREFSPPPCGEAQASGTADAPQAAILLVITSENGFVGGFNDRLIDKALEVRRPEERLFMAGRRGEIAGSERDLVPDAVFAMTSRRDGVTPLARRIAKRLARVSSVRLVFARQETGMGYAIELRPVLPLGIARTPGAVPLDRPLHHLPGAELMDGLASEYLFAEIADALMESLASENAARLRTMDAAARNIDERLEKLTRKEHVARQEQTTSDMLDVVTGAEAVNHG